MNAIFLATGALLIASAAPAFAQDAAPTDTGSTAASAAADGATFTGPRAEIFGGWIRGGTRVRVDNGSATSSNKTHNSGGTAGALLGYDMPIGDKLTAGIYGSYALSTSKTCNFATVPGQFGGCTKTGRDIEGGARVGYKVMPSALVYLRGAYVNGQLRSTSGNGTSYVSSHDNRDGWRAGAGVEYAVSQHAYVKAEYAYTRFATEHADDTSTRFDRNQVLAGFGIHF